MQISVSTYLIVLPLLFLAGFIDAIGGGGGLISIPAYMLAGMPAHTAVASNKLSSIGGTFFASARFIRNGYVDFRLAVPYAVMAFLGSALGAKLNLLVSDRFLTIVLLILLPLVAIMVLKPYSLGKTGQSEFRATTKLAAVGSAAAFILGAYDGFYGPGMGTLMIVTFCFIGGMDVLHANAHTKVVNFMAGFSALLVYLSEGAVVVQVALPAMICNIAGSYVGTGLALKNGEKIARPVIIGVLLLLIIKIVSDHYI